MAVFWKSFTAFTRAVTLTQVLALVAVFLGFWVILLFTSEDAREASLAAMVLPGILVPMTLLMGPLFLRNDLRTDFQRMEIMRTLPLSGRDVNIIGLLVPVVFGVTVALRLFPMIGAWAAAPAVLAAVLTLAGEVVALVVLLGDAYEGLDPSAEGLLG